MKWYEKKMFWLAYKTLCFWTKKQSIAPNMKGNLPLPLKQSVDDKLIDIFNM